MLDDEDSLPKVLVTDGTVGISFIEDKISEFILKLRISPELRDTTGRLPIIFMGFRSLRSLLRTERFPKLLSSQGVYYLKLPADVTEVNKIINTAKQTRIESPLEAVRSSIKTSDDISREQSSIIHTKGNFFGSEKLLYGAYLERHISIGKLNSIVKETRDIQREYCKEDLLNYELQMLDQPTYDAKPDLGEVKGASLYGKILFIDDLAYFGWGRAIAETLSAGQEQRIKPEVRDGLVVSIYKSDGDTLILESWSKDHSTMISEDTFFNSLLKKLDEPYMNDFDVILLDLRLKRSADENLTDPSAASGTEVLKKIRQINAGIPLIVLTASRMARNMDKVFHLGADGYFVKEINVANDEDAKDYLKKFMELVNFALSKSYLGPAWKVIRKIEGMNDVMSEEMSLLKKAVALIKKRPYSFEKNIMNFDTVCDSLVFLANVRDHKKSRVNSLDSGFLIGGLRNFVAHSGNDTLSEFDIKIALYLTFRLYITQNCDYLNKYVEKAFNNRSALPDIIELFLQSYRKLASLTEKTYIAALKVTCDDIYPKVDKRKPSLFSKHCDVAKGNVRNHYLFFLCSLPIHADFIYRPNEITHPCGGNKFMKYQKYSQADKVVLFEMLQALSEDAYPKESATLNGTIRKNLFGTCEIDIADKDIKNISCTEQDIKAIRDIIQTDPVSVTFELVRMGYTSYRAINIKINEEQR
ncbi:MAG: response regulator [Nitrospirae bacterium]|nr:response regulator [Nitrospirota bacterium]